MSPRAEYARRRARDMARLRGPRVEYQRVSILDGGSTPYQHPPRLAGLVVDGAHALGATALKVRATTLIGRFVTGDTLCAAPLAVAAADVTLSGTGSATVPLAAPLTAPLADGTPLTPTWAGLIITYGAEPQTYAIRLQDGERIQGGDEMLSVPAIDFATAPTPQDLCRYHEAWRTVIGFTPRRAEGHAVWYDLQVRL